MKKAVVESASAGIEYADIPLAPGTSARSNLLFDLKRDHMYLMTDKKLSKVRVQDCEQYKDCNQCLRVKHPYCGWCSLENKCRYRHRPGQHIDAMFTQRSNKLHNCEKKFKRRRNTWKITLNFSYAWPSFKLKSNLYHQTKTFNLSRIKWDTWK